MRTDGGFLLGENHPFYLCPPNQPDWTCSATMTNYLHVREVWSDGTVMPPADQLVGCGSGLGDALAVPGGELIAVTSARKVGACPPDNQLLSENSSLRVVRRQLSGAMAETAVIDAVTGPPQLVRRSDGAWLAYDTFVVRLDLNGRVASAPIALPTEAEIFNQQTPAVTALGNRLAVTDGNAIDLLDDNGHLVDAVPVETHNTKVSVLGSPRGDSVLAAFALWTSTGAGEVRLARYDCAP